MVNKSTTRILTIYSMNLFDLILRWMYWMSNEDIREICGTQKKHQISLEINIRGCCGRWSGKWSIIAKYKEKSPYSSIHLKVKYFARACLAIKWIKSKIAGEFDLFSGNIQEIVYGIVLRLEYIDSINCGYCCHEKSIKIQKKKKNSVFKMVDELNSRCTNQ